MNHRAEVTSHFSGEPFTVNCDSRHFAPDMRIYPVDGDLRLHVDVAAGIIRGEVTWTLLRLAPDARDLTFNAVDLEVTEVAGHDCELDFLYDGQRINVRLNNTLECDAPKITIRWTVELPKAGFYFIGNEQQRTRALSQDSIPTTKPNGRDIGCLASIIQL